MPERTTELTPQDAVNQSEALYRTVRETHEKAVDTLDFTGEGDWDDDGGERVFEPAYQAEDDHAVVVAQVKEFSADDTNMDLLREAATQEDAIREAAQRVAAAYETTEPTQESPDTGEYAD
jgi:hypothetical protein